MSEMADSNAKKTICMAAEDAARKQNAFTNVKFFGQKQCSGSNCMSGPACFSAIQALANQLAHQGTPEPAGAPDKDSVKYVRHSKSVHQEAPGTITLTHTRYYYTMPCNGACTQ